MPDNVRVQELPGLLKRYKDGVPGWELKAVDLDSVIGGRPAVPKEELLQAVKERSPVYTHKEVVLGGVPQTEQRRAYVPVPGHAGLTQSGMAGFNDYQQAPSQLGRGVSHGEPAFEGYGQDGDQYSEIVLLSPEARQAGWGQNVHHFHKDYPAMRGREMSPEVRTGLANEGVAHARFDIHDGFLRVNELQSDLGIHNRKAREYAAQNPQTAIVDGQHVVQNDPASQGLPFPLEDSSLELLLKRLNLYAAQNGLRGVEIASPRSIADKVGGNIDNYEHAYGKVAVGQQERLGRKMGGMESVPVAQAPDPVRGTPYSIMGAEYKARDAFEALVAHAHMYKNPDQASLAGVVEDMVDMMRVGEDATPDAERLQRYMVTHAVENGWPVRVAESMVNRNMQDIMREAENWVHLRSQRDAVADAARDYDPPRASSVPPAYRGVMSDEMRRRLIEGGVGAAVATGVMSQDDLIDRLNQ
jgi:hypothetical protein